MELKQKLSSAMCHMLPSVSGAKKNERVRKQMSLWLGYSNLNTSSPILEPFLSCTSIPKRGSDSQVQRQQQKLLLLLLTKQKSEPPAPRAEGVRGREEGELYAASLR